MKKFFKIFILIGAIIFATSCEKKIPINIPTASPSGVLYSLGNSIATTWNEDLKDVRAVSQGSNGGIENLNLIYAKEAQMSMGVTSVVYQSYMGEGVFEGRPNKDLRILFGLYYNPNQIVVTKDKGVESFSDIKNISFAPGAYGSTTVDEFNAHAKVSGLDPSDFKLQYMGPDEASDLIRNKQLNGVFIMSGVPNSKVMELTSTANCTLLSLDDEFLDNLIEAYPWYSKYTIKKGTYEKIDRDINTSAIKMVLYATKDMDDVLAYRLTKSFFENLEELKKSNPALRDVSIENAQEDLAGLPIHDGAMRYYEEVK